MTDDEILAAFRQWLEVVPDAIEKMNHGIGAWPVVKITLRERDTEGNIIRFVAGITFGDEDEESR